jgi:hypothetical protein
MERADDIGTERVCHWPSRLGTWRRRSDRSSRPGYRSTQSMDSTLPVSAASTTVGLRYRCRSRSTVGRGELPGFTTSAQNAEPIQPVLARLPPRLVQAVSTVEHRPRDLVGAGCTGAADPGHFVSWATARNASFRFRRYL